LTATTLPQIATLGRRAVIRTARQPANVIFPLVFPMLLLAVNAGGLKAATNLPGFPTNSFLAFALAVPFVQGALLATVNANVEFARDIQTGFLNRLALTPVRALVLLFGQLGGLVTIALVQAVFYLAVGLAFGVRLESGFGGAALLLVLETMIALAFAAFGSWAALRTGSTEAVQGLFPVFFVFLFMSSMNIPRNLIEADWFRWVATANPVSYLIEAVRSLVIEGWNWEALGLGFGVATGMTIVGFALAARALWNRLERT
jgi:ABC-2 type transport system permease protein